MDEKINLVVGIKVGDTVYTSGLVSSDSDGNVIGDDVYRQSSQIFKNIQSVLYVAEAGMSDIVKSNTFLSDMSQYREFSKARNQVIASETPASAAFGTPALVLPSLRVEVEAIAIFGSGK